MDFEQTNSTHSDQNFDIQKRNIIEEMNALNKRMQNSSNEIYKTSSSWDKRPNAQNNKIIEILIKEMMNYIIKIDNTLTKVDTALITMDTVLTKVDTALAKVDTDLITMDTVLTKMDTDIAKVDTALTKVDSDLAKVDTALTKVGSGLAKVAALSNNKIQNKRETKTSWDNRHL